MTARAFGYVRVSELREASISPGIQRDEITAFCERKGWTIAGWFEDIDVSGRAASRHKRRGLDALLDAALAGGCEVVVFYRIDRLSREEADFHAILATLTRAGIHCDSVGNPNDGSPESGLIWSISAALAKYESVKLGSRIRDSHRRLAKTGRFHGGEPPYGYRRRSDGGPGLEPEPTEAAHRTRMHEWYQVRGWSLHRIARELNATGVPTKRGGTWSQGQVSSALFSPYQAGARLDADGELVTDGNVAAIIPMETYRRTLAVRGARTGLGFQGGRTSAVALSGRIVRCGTCGRPLYTVHRANGVALRCEAVSTGRCPRGVDIKAELLEAAAERLLFQRLRSREAPEMPGKRLTSVPPPDGAADAAADALVRLAMAYAEGAMGREEYEGARRRLQAKAERAERERQRAAAGVERESRHEGVEAVWADLRAVTPEAWRSLGVEVRRDLYELLAERVTVHPRGHRRRVVVTWR